MTRRRSEYFKLEAHVLPSFPRSDNPACADPTIDPDVFFPETADDMVGSIESLRAICNRCPEIAACLSFAVDNSIPHGVWGGMTPNERRRINVRVKRTSMVEARDTLYEVNALIRRGMGITEACKQAHISTRSYQRYVQHEKTGWKHWSAGKPLANKPSEKDSK